MASFYSSEGDYSLNQKLGSYRSSELDINNKLYASHELVGPESFRSRDEMMFTRPTSSVDQINRQLSFAPRYSDGNTIIADANSSEQILQYHGLSLSLGSQEQQPLAHLHSGLNQYTNSSLCSLLNSNNDLKNGQYLSFDSAGKDQNTVKYGTFQNNVRSDFTGTLCSSKYLKAAQDLLDELVSVHRVSKISEKVRNFDSVCQDGVSGETQEPVNNASIELSLSERNDLHNKLTKLVSMLDEVDRRYKQYWHQMQALISSLDSVAGPGIALPYTTLALRTISRQFRSLRDAIKKQIHSAQKSLGEQDDNTHGGGVLSRLRYVDQQLRQQKAIQQFGVVRQSWRPQRGLPETAVSVLRAWLFEHFLHPYPKDSEKIVLARETGLTRSQVANWFINARVRLWKPMIEEMYKEEFGDAETELKSSPEHATTTQETSIFNDRGEEFQRSLISPMVDEYQRVHSNELRPDLISNAATDIDACRGLNYANDVIQSNEVNFGLIHMQHKNIVNVSGDSNFCDNNKSADGTMGNQVTLALGLERSEKDSKSMADGIQLRENEYYYVDPVNNQNRFANSHLLSDFVA